MKLYLHIGFGKTGTSSIQDFLFQNIKNIEYLYPRVGLMGSGHHALAPLGKECFSDDERNRFSELIEEIAESDKNSVVISSEFFCFSKPQYIRDISLYFDRFDVKIIFYVRNQIELIESAYLQWVKVGWDYGGSIEKFYSVHGNGFDFMQRIRPWVEHFGKEKIVTRLYDRRIVGDDVCADFLKMIGSDLNNYVPLVAKSNESLLPELSPVIEFLDSASKDSQLRAEVMKMFLNLSSRLRQHSRKKLIDSGMVKKIRDRYTESNKQLSELFIDENERKIFNSFS